LRLCAFARETTIVKKILSQVQEYYDEKLQTHGATARGVDWKSPESQELRFAQLVKLIDAGGSFSINDYGCGYGALVDYLERGSYQFQYVGFDISTKMIAQARELYAQANHARFISDRDQLQQADYTLASGIFNVKLNTDDAAWTNYILEVLETMNAISRTGFAFNALTKYSDAEFMRPDLYYADPLFFFDYCKTRYSRFVTLLHDYPLYEFTILVRKG
jgi:SAM-dependent methyltransferase